MTTAIHCPSEKDPSISGPQLIGCGSTNIVGPDEEGWFDCLDCGLFFKLNEEEE